MALVPVAAAIPHFHFFPGVAQMNDRMFYGDWEWAIYQALLAERSALACIFSKSGPMKGTVKWPLRL